jgi:hypothetical protein
LVVSCKLLHRDHEIEEKTTGKTEAGVEVTEGKTQTKLNTGWAASKKEKAPNRVGA